MLLLPLLLLLLLLPSLLLLLARRPQAEHVRRPLVARHRQPRRLVAAAEGQAVDGRGVHSSPELAQLAAVSGGEHANLGRRRGNREQWNAGQGLGRQGRQLKTAESVHDGSTARLRSLRRALLKATRAARSRDGQNQACDERTRS